MLSKNAEHLVNPRPDSIRTAASVLLAARNSVDGRRTPDCNVLTILWSA